MSVTGNEVLTDSVATLRIAVEGHRLERTVREVMADKPLQRGVRLRKVGAPARPMRPLHAQRHDDSLRWADSGGNTVGRRQRKQIIAR